MTFNNYFNKCVCSWMCIASELIDVLFHFHYGIRVVEFSREGCKIRLIFFNEKNEKDSDDFWRRKVTLKMKFGHLLSTSPLHHFVKLNDFLLICWFLGKAQLISKWFLGSSIFLQKMNEQIRLYYYDTSSRLVFVRFLEEIDDPKKPFRN